MKKNLLSTRAFLFLPVIMFFLLSSCTLEPDNISDIEAVCFDTQVLPILKTSCGISGCHDGSEEHFTLGGYVSVMDLVQPGDPRGSKLYKIITDIRNDDMMPPDNPLSRTQRNIIQVWIAQGANETLCNQDTGEFPIDRICFVQDILPVILSSCGVPGCHDQVTAEEDYVFTDYSGIMDGIEPFDLNDSEIYESVTETGDDIMPPPPRAPLTAQQIDALKEWIEDGATNSDCPGSSCDSSGIISYISQVDPFLKNACIGCHNSTLANGNVNLAGYANVSIQASNLRNGIPLIIGSMKRMSSFVAMPPAYSADDCNIILVEKWIEQGAENN
jgi:hypothetical protein